ncbi:hypothetical protein KC19_10G143400 [Ceratodon purpureus]|uniref:Uncharacterized protein n=1 Tax=Ceratodon purpureus TaxID=3225 RepID=A0A8T0GKD8_CERPU|nr:hypothetical protein KC19_10G143400 [Ceratodon purpureus]
MEEKKNFADTELENEVGYFKEPTLRLKNAEMEVARCNEEGDMEKALHLAMQAILLKAIDRVDPRKTGEGDNDMTVTTIMAIAKAMIQRGDPKCVNYLQRALLINHELHGPDHDSNFPIHEGFGDFYMNLGDSRAFYKEKQTLKSKDASIGINAKKIENEYDDYKKAMEEYATAYEKIAGSGNKTIAFQSGGKLDSRMGNMFSKAAKVQSRQGNDKEAAIIYEKAIRCLENASKPNKAKLAQMYYELGVSYHKAKQYSNSINACKSAIAYVNGEKKEGEKDSQEPLLLLIKKQQAISFYDGNEVENAKAMFEELMALQRKEYGGSSIIVAETLKYLGDVHVALKDKPQAEKFYSRALHILKKRLGPTDQTVKQLEQYTKQLNLKE